MEGEEREMSGSAKTRSLALLLILIILVPIIASIILYYLPLSDVQVRVEGTYLNSEPEYDLYEIVIVTNVTNNGMFSQYVHLTGEVVFSTEPDTVFSETYRSIGPIDAGNTISKIRVRVPVPEEFSEDPYNISCHVSLPPVINEYNTDGMVIFTVIWLVLIAAVTTALVRARRRG